jgi:hypothetical protein
METMTPEELDAILVNSSAAVLQYGEHMMVDPSKSHLSVNLLDYPEIKELADRLNFNSPLVPQSVDINWYRSENYFFEPHVDYYSASTVIFPITPIEDFKPIDFYDRTNLNYVEGESHDIIHTHNYTVGHGTIFNSHWPHGIRKLGSTGVHRAALRFRTNEKFHSIMEKYKNGTLLK